MTPPSPCNRLQQHSSILHRPMRNFQVSFSHHIHITEWYMTHTWYQRDERFSEHALCLLPIGVKAFAMEDFVVEMIVYFVSLYILASQAQPPRSVPLFVKNEYFRSPGVISARILASIALMD